MTFWTADSFNNDPFLTSSMLSRDPFSLLLSDPMSLMSTPMASNVNSLTNRRDNPPSRYPRLQVLELDNAFLVKADLPGLTKEDVTISLNDNVLCVEGERKKVEVENLESIYLDERFDGKFKRTYRLPINVDPEQCDAKMCCGVLEITVGKKKEAQSQRKRIEIKGEPTETPKQTDTPKQVEATKKTTEGSSKGPNKKK